MAAVRMEGGRSNVEGGGMTPDRRKDLELAALVLLRERSGLESEQPSALEERSPSKPVKLGPLPKCKHRPSQLRRGPERRQQGVSDEVLKRYSRGMPGRSIN